MKPPIQILPRRWGTFIYLLLLAACTDPAPATGTMVVSVSPTFAQVTVASLSSSKPHAPAQVEEREGRSILTFHLPPNIYVVKAGADGYQSAQINEQVLSNRRTHRDIDLLIANKPPVAKIEVSDADAPLGVQLDASGSQDPDGQIVSYHWDLGDGRVVREPKFMHSYAAPGSYRVSLEVTDDDGATAQAHATVSVTAADPVAHFSATPQSGSAPLTVTFDAAASSGGGVDLTDYRWTFGDGAAGNGRVVTHIYSNVGNYDAALTVTNAFGETATVSHQVEVKAPTYRLEPLMTSKDGHTLRQGNKPFFWLGDTAWLLFSATRHDDVLFYLDDAKAKGFTVVQVNLTAAWSGNGRNGVNAFGEQPFVGNDPTQLNPAYFDYAEWVIDEAAKRGLYVAIPYGEPARTNDGRVVYELKSTRHGYAYARALGERFRRQTLDHQIIWLNGQDRSPSRDLGEDVWLALAEGLADGVNGENSFDGRADYASVLMSYHTDGDYTSSQYFHTEPWLDFNAINSWKVYWRMVRKVEGDYRLSPTKPSVCFEASYENQQFPMASDRDTVELRTDWHARFQGYWCLLSGAAGYAYGHENGYQVTNADDWPAYLESPGRTDMRHLRSALASHALVPDQTLVMSDDGGAGESKDYIPAARAPDASTAFIYTTDGSSFTLDLGKLSGVSVDAQWFDPRAGIYHPLGIVPATPNQTFDPPGNARPGNDWLLVLEALL